jgi:tetratricopeptide (TPR) repeat protein
MKIEEKIRSFTGSNKFFPFFLALAAFAAFAPSLGTRGFFYDDQPLIEANTILHQGFKAFPKLLSTGYWEMVKGKNAPVEEYRPLLMATFLLETRLFGWSPFEMHALNLFLHFLASCLVFLLLRRRMNLSAAKAGALLFAVLAVHMESVSLLVGRSELLSAVFILGAWICLDFSRSARSRKRLLLGIFLYAAALLTKESSIMFLPMIFLDDWVLSRKTSDLKNRQSLYAALSLTSGTYLLLRLPILMHPFHGGVAYFNSSRLIQYLTMGRFFWEHYFFPSVSALGICSDFSRPLIPDALTSSSVAWASLSTLALFLLSAFYFLVAKRSVWAFWVVFPFLFLLPTSHLIIPLDTIGAQRFLYLPSVALCAGFGFFWMRFGKRSWGRMVTSFLLIWQASKAFSQSYLWTTPIGFYSAAAACNPVSASAQYSLGVRFFRAGQDAKGLSHMALAEKLNPRYSQVWYDLGRFAWDKKDLPRAKFFLERAIRLNPSEPDARVLLAELWLKEGNVLKAERGLKDALEIAPDNATAHYNLGILLLKSGKTKKGASQLRKFLQISPDNRLAPSVSALLSRIELLNTQAKPSREVLK